jgi:hypothetical protein
MHHYEIGEIDGTQGKLRPFEVRVDETGFDAQEALEVAKLTTRSPQTRERLNTAQAIVALTQVGPSTGEPTFSEDWADGMLTEVLDRCPSGRVTGLTVVRESADYPVVSGEVVTVKGYCIE